MADVVRDQGSTLLVSLNGEADTAREDAYTVITAGSGRRIQGRRLTYPLDESHSRPPILPLTADELICAQLTILYTL